MRIRNATIQITKAKRYENADFAILSCENPDGWFPCNIDLWVKAASSEASHIKYDYSNMMSTTNIPRSMVGIGGIDEDFSDSENPFEGKDSEPDYVFENLDSCARYSCRTLGFERDYFTVAIKCRKGTLSKAFFEATDISHSENIAGKSYDVSRINGLSWMHDNFESEKGGVFYDKSKEFLEFGKLYTYAEAVKHTPKGWHLPTEQEMAYLMGNIGGYKKAGEKLRSRTGWGDANGTDDVGFHAIPSGYSSNSSFSGMGEEFRMWLAEANRYCAIDENEEVKFASDKAGSALSVRFVKDCKLIDTAPRFGGETFSCESFKSMPYGVPIQFRDYDGSVETFRDKIVENIPIDEEPVYKYSYPLWNLEAGRYFNIMFRDGNDDFHLVEVPKEWQSLTQKQKYQQASNWVLHSCARPPDKMKFYYYIKECSTQRKKNVDASIGDNWTNGLPVPVCDPFPSYEKRGNDCGFPGIDPFQGFNQESVRKMITPYQGRFSDCVLVMDKYESDAGLWSAFSMALYGRSWIFYDGINYRLPETAKDTHVSTPGDSKGDIIRPDIDNAFLWFKGKSVFERQMNQAARKEGVIAVLDGEIDAVPYFLSDINSLTVYEAKLHENKFAWAYSQNGIVKGYACVERTPECINSVLEFNKRLKLIDVKLSSFDYWLAVLSLLDKIKKEFGCQMRDLDEYEKTAFEGYGGVLGFIERESMFLEFVPGTKLKCSAIAIEGVIPNDCNKLELPETDVEFVRPRCNVYGHGALDRSWDDLISLFAKSLVFMNPDHSGYKLMQESVWEQGLPSRGKLDFRANAIVKKRGGGGDLSVKITDSQLRLSNSDEEDAGFVKVKELILENSQVSGIKENYLYAESLEVFGECSIAYDMKDWGHSIHFADKMIIHKGAVLKVCITSDECAESDAGTVIILNGELNWDVQWVCFYDIAFDGVSLKEPAKLFDARGALRLTKSEKFDYWKNAYVVNALALAGTPPLLNSKAEYWEDYEDIENNKYVTEFMDGVNEDNRRKMVVPDLYWHFGVKEKLPGDWSIDYEEKLMEFKLREDSAWDIGKYYNLAGEYLGWFAGKDLENQSIKLKLPEDESYFGKAGVYCMEDGVKELSPFTPWNSIEADLAATWIMEDPEYGFDFKINRRCKLILEHFNGLWIGTRRQRPVFELWFSPDIINIPMVKLDMPIKDVDKTSRNYKEEDDDILEVKNAWSTNLFTKLRLRMNMEKFPHDINNGKIEVRFQLANKYVVVAKTVRTISTIKDCCFVRFHSHYPESKQLIKEQGSVMVDITNTNSWADAVSDDVAFIVNKLEFDKEGVVKGIADFVPFEVKDKRGKPVWYGDKYPIKNELGYTIGARRKLKVLGAGSIRLRVNLKGAITSYEDRGWLCDESLRQNAGKKLDLVAWLPQHLKNGEFVEFIRFFQDTLNNCFADNASNNPIGILEKIARLSDLRNVDAMEPRFFQYYAELFGMELTVGMKLLDVLPEDDRGMYARDVLKAYMHFQKEKTSLSSLQTLLSMFGVFAEVKYLYSNRYDSHDESDWTFRQSSTNRRTQHFSLLVRTDDDELLAFSPAFKQLIDDIKPVTTVFKGWAGTFGLSLEDGSALYVSIGSNVKSLNTIEDSEVQKLLWLDENLLENQTAIDEREDSRKYISENYA